MIRTPPSSALLGLAILGLFLALAGSLLVKEAAGRTPIQNPKNKAWECVRAWRFGLSVPGLLGKPTDLGHSRRGSGGLPCRTGFSKRCPVGEGCRETRLLPFRGGSEKISSVPHSDACALAGVEEDGWKKSGGLRRLVRSGPLACWTGCRCLRAAGEARGPGSALGDWCLAGPWVILPGHRWGTSGECWTGVLPELVPGQKPSGSKTGQRRGRGSGIVRCEASGLCGGQGGSMGPPVEAEPEQRLQRPESGGATWRAEVSEATGVAKSGVWHSAGDRTSAHSCGAGARRVLLVPVPLGLTWIGPLGGAAALGPAWHLPGGGPGEPRVTLQWPSGIPVGPLEGVLIALMLLDQRQSWS
ncbi:hypothetical protein NDU88_000975 [Pleurodeles waltl]|uniref:Uncharacterized protein n=1 Tax=Pleurodeles waltl TaxID=8319 RepID=A0AAV7URI8_PLEWA|nr:hypothetical protein NDU88_000975 [Pleurodeles waltl]